MRVSESGLGCGPGGSGLRGWPLCEGRLLPRADLQTATEYSHRLLASVVTVLLIAIVWQAMRHFRDRRGLLAASVAALALLLVQAGLGGLTVEYGLDPALVAAHLGAAMLLLATLIGISAAARMPRAVPVLQPRLTAGLLACVLLLATIVAGGVIAGSERHGAQANGDAEPGAHYACGMEFPTCGGAFLPFGRSEPVDIQLAHRGLMFLAVAAIAAFALLLGRRPGMRRLAAAIVAVLAIQVALGALNVWLDPSQLLVLAHLTVATLLWGLVVSATVLSDWRPPARDLADRRHRLGPAGRTRAFARVAPEPGEEGMSG